MTLRRSIRSGVGRTETWSRGATGERLTRLLLLGLALWFALTPVIGWPARSPSHEELHLLAFAWALAALLVMIALQPTRAAVVLPPLVAASAAVVLTATVDVARGRTGLTSELQHGLELVATALVWRLRPSRRRRVSRALPTFVPNHGAR